MAVHTEIRRHVGAPCVVNGSAVAAHVGAVEIRGHARREPD
ncbi:hypothetical protein AB0D57_34935 [Streptomyces sp. NPDC048275]